MDFAGYHDLRDSAGFLLSLCTALQAIIECRAWISGLTAVSKEVVRQASLGRA